MARIKLAANIELVETNKQIAKLMLLEIVKELNKRIPTRMNNIDTRVRQATYLFLKTNETYESLISGELSAHFGIPITGREVAVNSIIKAVSDNMAVEFTPVTLLGRRFKHGITFRVVMNNLSEVLGLLEGRVLTKKGEVLEWLRWLLTLGDTIIISEYEIKLESGKGRSRGGIMVPKGAGVWRVPPQYAGTQNDNWLTRAFKNNSTTYLSIIEKILKDELQRM